MKWSACLIDVHFITDQTNNETVKTNIYSVTLKPFEIKSYTCPQAHVYNRAGGTA